MEEGVSMGKRPELTGGGLVRSVGGWLNLMERGLKRKSLIIFHESENVKDVPIPLRPAGVGIVDRL
jgi:hypothetical protein